MTCRSRMLRVAVLATATIGCASFPALASAAPAPPPPGNALFVNQGSPSASVTAAAAPAKPSCTNTPYTTVQSAVDAAKAGQTVYLCGTTPYQESVLVTKNLTLTGDPGAAIQASPTDPSPNTTFFSSQGLKDPESVLTVIGKANVQVQGLTIEGPFAINSCDAGGGMFGVLQINGGQIQLMNDQVTNIEAADQTNLGGCQYGVGIQAGREYWPALSGGDNVVDFVGNAQIQNTTVTGYQKNGITVDGPKSQAQIQQSTIDGGGTTAAIARNGIQISRGATGQIQNNRINDNEYTGTGAFASATGVLVFGGCGDPLAVNVQVQNNSLANNDSGVVLNNFTPDPNCVASATSPTNNQVHNNTISKTDGVTNNSPFTDEMGNGYAGYQVGIADTGNGDQIHDNTISDGSSGAYGPQTTPGPPFLAPIDIQTYPPIKAKVQNNTFDGSKTNPPY